MSAMRQPPAGEPPQVPGGQVRRGRGLGLGQRSPAEARDEQVPLRPDLRDAPGLGRDHPDVLPDGQPAPVGQHELHVGARVCLGGRRGPRDEPVVGRGHRDLLHAPHGRGDERAGQPHGRQRARDADDAVPRRDPGDGAAHGLAPEGQGGGGERLAEPPERPGEAMLRQQGVSAAETSASSPARSPRWGRASPPSGPRRPARPRGARGRPPSRPAAGPSAQGARCRGWPRPGLRRG